MPEIDKNTFNDLKEMSGEDFIVELIDTFLEDSPKMIAEIKSAYASGDVEAFRRAAHSLKSNAATFGAQHLAALAKELEMLGKENKLNEIGDRLKTLDEVYEAARRELAGLKS
jgi:HPt (histidine-containing phosphotransfer) domain-containing protein